jgi:hypothetical protein
MEQSVTKRWHVYLLHLPAYEDGTDRVKRRHVDILHLPAHEYGTYRVLRNVGI